MDEPSDRLDALVDELLESDDGELVPSPALAARAHAWLTEHGDRDPTGALLALASLAHASSHRNGRQVREVLGNVCRAWLRACGHPSDGWRCALEATGELSVRPDVPWPDRPAQDLLGRAGPVTPLADSQGRLVKGDALARYHLSDFAR